MGMESPYNPDLLNQGGCQEELTGGLDDDQLDSGCH